MALADYQGLVPQLVRDPSGSIATGDRDQAIALMVERYSKDRPRLLVADVTAPGGSLLDLPAGWSADFSAVVAIETPVGDVPATFLDGEDYRLYQTPSGFKLQLDAAPAAGTVLRVTFTARHVLDAGTDTIPVKDREAVSCWAAALLLDQLASLFSAERFPTIAADAVDHASKGRDYAARARDMRRRYWAELGIVPDRIAPAGTVVVTNPRDSLGRRTRLTHLAGR